MAWRTGASHAARETAETPKPILFKKSLRECPRSSSGPGWANYSLAFFTNEVLLVSCTRPFQYIFLDSISRFIATYSLSLYCFSTGLQTAGDSIRLIVTLRTLETTNVFNRQATLVQLEKSVVIGIAPCIDVGLPVAVETPAHSQQRVLANNFHLFNGTVTGFALNAPYNNVLGVVEVGHVGEVVDTYPLDRFVLIVSANDFRNFSFAGECSRLDLVVAVHTNVHRRDGSIFALGNACVTILAINLVFSGMNLMRERNRLTGSVSLLNSHGVEGIHHRFECQRRNNQRNSENKSAATGYSTPGNG